VEQVADSAERTVQSGAFLIAETDPQTLFVPEHFDEEDRLMGDTVEKFILEEVVPRAAEIDEHKEGVVKELMAKLGELGVFMADVPEELDGLGASKKVIMLMAEKIGMGRSFAPPVMVQSGIGGLPILYFGTDEQRARHLEGIMTGTKVAAYALTETESGSDALAARSTARWDEEKGVYILNGAKQFITNAGNADIFIIFAKVDGEHFTCFFLEDGMPGLSTGVEEHKMGLKGSSTRAVIFEDVPVPKENVLGEVGKGHRIAFNVLNIGRLKLTPSLLGGMKTMLGDGIRYAGERQQFGKSLSEFGLIKQKIAGAVVRIYCSESMCYRTADLIDTHVAAAKAGGETTAVEATVEALKELAVECSINKIYGSEALSWIADEMLQLHGGYGYIQEYPIEGHYRDSRIHRIWEGTNEINRMIITGTLMKRSMAGELPLLGVIKQISDELMARRGGGEVPDGPLGEERAMIVNAKKMTLFAAGVAAQKYLDKLQDQQEILAWVADMVTQTFAMESAVLRTLRLVGEGDEAVQAARTAAARFAVEEGMQLVENRGRSVLAATAAGEELRSTLSMLKKLTRRQPIDLVAAGHTIADYAVEREGYPFI
jgi:alkylation response protein AidB-like acyl-CoA dehydrogenase